MANWAQFEEQMIGLPVVGRGKNSIHFRGGDGSIEAHFTGKPCHYQDTDGLWKPIDTSLLAKGNGFYGAPHSDVLIHPDGRVVVDGTGYQQITALPGSPTGYVDGDKIVREFSGGRQYLYMKEDGFRQEIILDKIPSLTVKNAQTLLATVSGSLPIKYIASQLTAVDAAGNMYQFDNLTNLRTWMTNAVYPVVIDPDFSGSTADGDIYGQNADYSTTRSTAYNVRPTITAVRVGNSWWSAFTRYEVARTFLMFDTSTIGADATVTQVNLKLVASYDMSSTDFNVQIVDQDWSAQNPLSSSNMDAAFDNCLSGSADINIWRNTYGMALNTQYTSGNLSTSWINKVGNTYYSLRSARDFSNVTPTGYEYIDIYSADHATASYRPVLTVVYSGGSSAGALLKIVMDGGVQNLCGGMRG